MGRKRWETSADLVPFVGLDGQRSDGKEWDRSCRDCLGYVKSILAECGWKRRNGKPLSEKSRTEYGNAIYASFAELKELGFGLKKPWNLESQHVEALCRLWASRGRSAATVQNRLTSLSWLGALMSRPGLVKGTHEYDDQFGEADMARHQAAERDKSPEGAGHARDEVIGIAMAEDETFGHLVLLQFALGLRDKEVIRARPLIDDCGDHWKLPPTTGGSKGGRARIIPLRQGAWQREAIDQVKAFVRRKGNGRIRAVLGWSGGKDVETEAGHIRSALRFDMDKYKALAEACGFTRKARGFTGHGFRHSFAHEEFKVHGYIPAIKVGRQSLAGMIRAIGNETAVGSEQKDAVVHAQTKVSEALGHSRPSVTSAYYGKTKYAKYPKVTSQGDAMQVVLPVHQT